MPDETTGTDEMPDELPDGATVLTEPHEFTEQSPLIHIFGDHSRARIFVALFHAPEPLNPSRIVEWAGLSSSQSWYDYRDDLLATGLVEQTGHAGNSPLYAMVEDDPRIEALHKLSDYTGGALYEHRHGNSE